MEKARILSLEEAAEYNRRVIWMDLIEAGAAMPVTYYRERLPFLQFDCENRVAMITVRAEYYGKTWRCWDRKPDEDGTEEGPDSGSGTDGTEEGPDGGSGTERTEEGPDGGSGTEEVSG